MKRLIVAVLKLARATAGKHNPDDLLDAAAYVALALEAEMGGGDDFGVHAQYARQPVLEREVERRGTKVCDHSHF